MRNFPIFLALLLAGCGGDGSSFAPTPQPDQPVPQPVQHAPEIANLSLLPNTVIYMDGDGSVKVTAQFEFTDVGLDIQNVRIDISDGTSLTVVPATAINSPSGTISEEFDFSTDQLGEFTVDIWLVDAAGDPSNSLSASIRVESPVPEIASLDPSEILSGGVGFELSVTGTDFLQGATVTWDGVDRATAYMSDTRVVASILATDLETPRTVSVRVRNPEPTAGVSNALSFVIDASGGASEPSAFPILITETIDGMPPNGPSVNGGLDVWGMYAIFASKASNLVAGDNNDAYDLFIREACSLDIDGVDCSPVTSRAVMAVGGLEPNGDVGWTDTSPEGSLAVEFAGRFVAFVSSASNLVSDDTNSVDDVFLMDTCIDYHWLSDGDVCTPEITRVSMGNDGSQATVPASHPAVALGGRYVVFVSADPNLVAADTNGVADVFLRDTCRGVGQGCTPSTTRVSVATHGGQSNGASSEPSFTGRYVAFSSLASNLVTGDSNGSRDVFLRDTCLGESACVPSTQLVSVGRLGDPADGPSWDPQVTFGVTDTEGNNYHGRHVAFVSSATNLVAVDTNAASDVFLRDLCTGNPGCMPSTRLISVTSAGAQIPGDSWGPAFLTWDGETVPFVTAADGVVPGDTNGVVDVYLWAGSTKRLSVGAGAQTDGDSYAPRASIHPYGAGPFTFISEASNMLPDVVVIPDYGNIYLVHYPD